MRIEHVTRHARRPWRRALIAVAAAGACAVPAIAHAVSTEVGRYDISDHAIGTPLPAGDTVADIAGAPEPGTVVVGADSTSILTASASPLTAGGSALEFGDAGCTTDANHNVSCAHLSRVVVPDTAGAFSPLSRNFSVSVVVQLLAPVPTTPDGGMNVVQKGWGGTSDYWKVSVDYGRVQCVLKINGSSKLVKAERLTPLAVGTPYRIDCTRVGSAWTLTVTPLAADGTGTPEPSIKAARSASGNLDNFGVGPAVSIGSKGQTLNPDQLEHAIIDDVVYRVG